MTKINPLTLEKGTKKAKDYMAKLREMRGKKKKKKR